MSKNKVVPFNQRNSDDEDAKVKDVLDFLDQCKKEVIENRYTSVAVSMVNDKDIENNMSGWQKSCSYTQLANEVESVSFELRYLSMNQFYGK